MDFQLTDLKITYAESLARYANNKKIADKLRDIFPYPYTIQDAKQFINSQINNISTRDFVKAIYIDNEAVGTIGALFKSDIYIKNVEIGYWLGESFWGKGIVTSAIKQMCSIIFGNYDIERIYAEPFANNFGSRKVLEKAGFQLEGILRNSVFKNNLIQDSCIYAICKNEWI